jgi:hypothetical protein
LLIICCLSLNIVFMKKRLLHPTLKYLAALLVLLALQTTQLQARSFSSGYVITNEGTRLNGGIHFNNITPGFVVFRDPSGRTTNYTAVQLLSFGIDKESEFVSRKIQYRNREQNVFLQRVIEGEFTYLYLKHKPDRFFIEHTDGALTEITSENFEETFNQWAGWCPRWSNQLRYSKPRHNRVKMLVDMVNNIQCRALPFSNAGVFAGSFDLTHQLNNHFFKESHIFETSLTRNSITAGVWYERPIWKAPAFSIRYAAAIYQHRELNALYTFGDERFKVFEAERTDLNLSVLPTFNLNISPIIRPYLMAGPVGVLNLSQYGESVETWVIGEGNSQNYPNDFSLSGFAAGYTAGAGVHFYYMPNRYLAAEVQYLQLFFEKGHQANGLQLNLKINILAF